MSGPDCGRIIELRPGRHSLGSSATCAIRIDDPALAPHHAMVTCDGLTLSLECLGGPGSIDGGVVRVGSSVGMVRQRRIEVVATPQELHRSPMPEVPRPTPVRRVPPRPEPKGVSSVAWSSVLAAPATGLVVGMVSDHWYVALVSAVTAALAVVSWVVRIGVVEVRRRRWRRSTRAAEVALMEECQRYARELAARRRRAHPTLIHLRDDARGDGVQLWSQRRLAAVSIGCGTRAIDIVEGAPAVIIDDVPVLIEVSPSSVIGVHGHRSEYAVAALVMRMAAQVGPSDWQLVQAGPMPEEWDFVTMLAHTRRAGLNSGDVRTSRPFERHTVLLVGDPLLVVSRASPALRCFHRGNATVIVAAPTLRSLPAMCTHTVDADDVETDGITRETALEMAQELSRWIDPDLDEAMVPESVHFVDHVFDEPLTSESILDRWQQRRSPVLFVGMGLDDRVDIDLDSDGPHGVVVGTTGAGKSELLKTLVLSAAVNNAPDDLAFVLIDYKGGAAFDACACLAHVVGVITDLDGDLAERVLVGLEAELRRRERLLRDAGAGDLHSYRMTVRDDSEPLGRLVVVIDELAALREAVPTFLSALVTIAQRGRSLGVHLIVATQRPGTALSGDVMANATIRISLRVQSPADSIEVIGSDAASRLDRERPGRAIVRLGSDEPVVVQVAVVTSDLADIVSAVHAAVEISGCAPPRRPWVDPLPRVLPWPSQRQRSQVGVIDDIMNQRCSPALIDPEGHLLVIGAVGKSSALSTVARAMVEDDPEVGVVTVMCRSTEAESSPLRHCGERIRLDDRELVHRLLQLCTRRIASNRARGRLVLIIDDIDVWRTHHLVDRADQAMWDAFERVLIDGPAVGITCVVSATREQAVPTTVTSRMRSIWRSGTQVGIFHVDDETRACDTRMQLFHSDPHVHIAPGVPSRDLRHLSTTLFGSLSSPGAFAIEADSLEEMIWTEGETMRLVIIGPRGSGVSNAVSSMARAFESVHDGAQVIDAATVPRDEITSTAAQRPVLVVVDDMAVGAGNSSGHMASGLQFPAGLSMTTSIVVGVTPTFLRAHPDHWVHQIRRLRTGVLLGRSAEDDIDLLGVHSAPCHVYRLSPGRGLWVEAGRARGIVQFLLDDVVVPDSRRRDATGV